MTHLCRKVTSAAAANSSGVDEEIAAIGRFTQPIVPPRSTAMIPPSQVILERLVTGLVISHVL